MGSGRLHADGFEFHVPESFIVGDLKVWARRPLSTKSEAQDRPILKCDRVAVNANCIITLICILASHQRAGLFQRLKGERITGGFQTAVILCLRGFNDQFEETPFRSDRDFGRIKRLEAGRDGDWHSRREGQTQDYMPLAG